jgi:hypothetical protein
VTAFGAEQAQPANPPQPVSPPPQAAGVVAQRGQAAPAAAQPPQAASHGFGHKLLCYIPNRIFDVFDIVRARVRIGPGLAVGARVTKYTDIFMGAYKSFYIGLPGPRQVPRVPWPGGIESRSGLAASVADETVTSYDANPRYSSTEAGLGLQAVLVGAEVGVDAAELFDLAFGLLFIDFREDDL